MEKAKLEKTSMRKFLKVRKEVPEPYKQGKESAKAYGLSMG